MVRVSITIPVLSQEREHTSSTIRTELFQVLLHGINLQGFDNRLNLIRRIEG